VSYHLNLSAKGSLDKTDVITTPYPVFVIDFVSFMPTSTQPSDGGMTSGCCFYKSLPINTFSIHFADASLNFKSAEISDVVLDWYLLLE
tara:strand:+ start:2094 stop:2360 length:267 start_codon:yes stop_codon:yes gene_type:complete